MTQPPALEADHLAMLVERIAVTGDGRAVVVFVVAGIRLRLHVGEAVCFITGADGALLRMIERPNC